jgi:hypothetical protein
MNNFTWIMFFYECGVIFKIQQWNQLLYNPRKIGLIPLFVCLKVSLIIIKIKKNIHVMQTFQNHMVWCVMQYTNKCLVRSTHVHWYRLFVFSCILWQVTLRKSDTFNVSSIVLDLSFLWDKAPLDLQSSGKLFYVT